MSHRRIQGSKVLVTGANRGIGRALVEALLEQGASTVYAAARNTDHLKDLVEAGGERVLPLELDVTDAEQIERAGERIGDLDILINNAGISFFTPIDGEEYEPRP